MSGHMVKNFEVDSFCDHVLVGDKNVMCMN